MKKKPLKIKSTDEWELYAHQYSPENQAVKAVILFNSGTCILKEFYEFFCSYLADQGYIVISYDYRGVGESKGEDLSHKDISIINWAKRDMKAMINWMVENYPSHKKHLVAHSMGGQVIGLCDAMGAIDKIVTISSSYGNWHYYTKRKYATAFFVQILFPLNVLLHGYLPMKKKGLGEDYPKGIARNLTSWSWHKLAHSKIMDKQQIPHHYSSITQPLQAIFIADDFIATTKTIPYYREDFVNAKLEILQIKPQDYELKKIGHMGFFQANRPFLWKKVISFLERLNDNN